ncbi:transcription factor, putative [Ricinus communis]|uniref:Transcription factor, putative n=1 Tax=Ricinus communis TaxID=3988 RepID=B9T2F4_RICCO|nr:transcription factor, putative [Ricinus communis]|eukprot:XP_002532423.1 protein NLP2 [Ricinus communis]
MDHAVSALNSTLLTFSSTSMDLDFLDKSLSPASWLESTDGINLLEPEPSRSSVLFDTSQYSPFKRPDHFSLDSDHQIHRKEIENMPENPSLDVYPGIKEHVADTTISLVQPEGGESGKRCLTDPSSTINSRLMIAIEYLKDYVEESDVLIQIWVPTNKGGQIVLTTIDQPYSLNPNCKGLASYRNVSKTFHLTADADLKESAGLPGRVFLGKLPEWTPDVRFFRSDECPRKNYAKLYQISGCLALPVFEQDSGVCMAVVEIVTTTQKISYHLEVEIVCKALEAVDLKGSQDCFPFGVKACNQFYQIAVPEISEILQSVYDTFRLPLAMTWAICDRQGESEQHQFAEEFGYCICTVDSACCVAENDLMGFHEACSEQYLFLDQGIVGKAFATNKQRFATDITSFSKTSYPLSHHARIFNLGAAVAIPLRNMYTGLVEYVLELFLPRDCKSIEEQKQIWDILPGIVQQACQSFHVIMDKELDNEVSEQVVVDLDRRLLKFVSSPSEPSQEESFWTPHKIDTEKKGKCDFMSWGCPKEEPEDEFKITTHWDNNELDIYQEQIFSDFDHPNFMLDLRVNDSEDSSVGQYRSLSSRSAGEKRQMKTEKTISLQVLRQYFAGSLKDAAKSIGVCPTTLKRICRQHGINRWPSRKIKKVDHSLRKLQLVVNSIRGAEGLIQVDSFYKTFGEFSSPKISGKGPLQSFETSDNSKKLNPQPETGLLRPQANDSKSQSSSCSQNSRSRICGCNEARQLNTPTPTNDLKNGCTNIGVEVPAVALKRTGSEAQLHSLNLPSLPKSTGQNLRDGVIFRVKATFGEENIRFSLLPNWGFRDLQLEIAKRFKIDDFTKIYLKYLDIDHESVLLTCDADLEECIDLLSLSHMNTIKISLHQASHQPNLGSSFSSSSQS